MRIDGEWLLCDDAALRPVIRGEILASDGTWQRAEFLVDTGASLVALSERDARRIGLNTDKMEQNAKVRTAGAVAA